MDVVVSSCNLSTGRLRWKIISLQWIWARIRKESSRPAWATERKLASTKQNNFRLVFLLSKFKKNVLVCLHYCVEVSGQLGGVTSFPPCLWRFQGLNWGDQACTASTFTHWAIPPAPLWYFWLVYLVQSYYNSTFQSKTCGWNFLLYCHDNIFKFIFLTQC